MDSQYAIHRDSVTNELVLADLANNGGLRETAIVVNCTDLESMHKAYIQTRGQCPSIINHIYFHYQKDEAILEGCTKTFTDLMKKNPSDFYEYFGGYYNGFTSFEMTDKMKSIITKVATAFYYLEEQKLQKYISSSPRNIVFFENDVSFDHPKLVLSHRGDKRKNKGLICLGLMLQDCVTLAGFGSNKFKMVDGEQDLIDSLFLPNAHGLQLNHHPALWAPNTCSRYIAAVDRFVMKEGANLCKQRHNSQVSWIDALPPGMVGAKEFKKYIGWIAELMTDSMLRDFYYQSVYDEGGSYANNVSGLLRFYRNIFPHFYNIRGQTKITFNRHLTPDEVNQQNLRLRTSIQKVEMRLRRLYPMFLVDVYYYMENYFKFNEW